MWVLCIAMFNLSLTGYGYLTYFVSGPELSKEFFFFKKSRDYKLLYIITNYSNIWTCRLLTNWIWFLFQFGNTCYCNSVLQALYFCRPFRDRVLQFKQLQKNNKKESLLTCLADLFYSIASQKKKVGTIAPKKFITRLRKEYGKCHSIYHCWK